ncbi:MAG: outer membrane lipoprotein-sorting protein [Calditrichaeota bacterium]|nr:MAG: outer membrane lipoprotein-sorting protein [Calditrichota bacterium]MBL1204820.1 outer membrane lipoprotein-sorting protein [Calditrichota bacterium]NOG44649.1 outer membrane lipoprotein-sorting protein [Calditrichota bacterium]
MDKLIILLILSTGLFAQSGREIAEKANATQRGFVDEVVETTMYLVNAKNDSVVRHLKNMTFERENSEDYSIIRFLNPPDVRGTGLLTYQNPAGDDQQWLYLPELRRVKRISSKNKSGAFMGSEFAYEDISGNTLDRFEYKYLGEDKLGDVDCYLVDRIPTYKNSGYLRIKTWYDKNTHLMLRNEFIDRKNSLLKVLTFKNWEQFSTGAWRAGKMTMENLQNGKTSILIFKNRKHKVGLKEKDFTKRSLQRNK